MPTCSVSTFAAWVTTVNPLSPRLRSRTFPGPLLVGGAPPLLNGARVAGNMDDWEPYVMVLADQSFSEVGLSPALLPGALRENVAFARDVTAWSHREGHPGAYPERPRLPDQDP